MLILMLICVLIKKNTIMSKTQEQIAKELHTHGNMTTWKKSDDGNIHMVNRQSGSVTNGGITIDKKGGISKTKL